MQNDFVRERQLREELERVLQKIMENIDLGSMYKKLERDYNDVSEKLSETYTENSSEAVSN